jgi:tetrapyrrole methylase family protein/MazG family protein
MPLDAAKIPPKQATENRLARGCLVSNMFASMVLADTVSQMPQGRRVARYIWTVPDKIAEPFDDPVSRQAGEKFAGLVNVMARLRAPGGCPWDRKQTFDSIKPYLLEETYEVMDAIDQCDWPAVAEELGDLLLQPVFFAAMAAEAQLFDIRDSLDAINQKLIRRHPHVFGDGTAKTAEDVKQRWDEIKKQEKTFENGPTEEKPILDGVPRTLPALVEADKISSKAAEVGFEWPEIDGVLSKIEEEARELAAAQQAGNQLHIEYELGDLLLTVVNLARFLKVDPEQALRKANGRFRERFGYIEKTITAEGRGFSTTTLDRMEELWQEAKHRNSDYNREF